MPLPRYDDMLLSLSLRGARTFIVVVLLVVVATTKMTATTTTIVGVAHAGAAPRKAPDLPEGVSYVPVPTHVPTSNGVIRESFWMLFVAGAGPSCAYS